MSKVQKAIATLEQFQAESEGVEQLTPAELDDIEGGFNISCKVTNTGCSS
jgi:hypothetical protein